MARKQEELTQEILAILKEVPRGLGAFEIAERLDGPEGHLSERRIRQVLNRLAIEGKVIRRRGKSTGPGAPPWLYFHPDNVSPQLVFVGTTEGLEDLRISTRAEIESEILTDTEERNRLIEAKNVLERIASAHVEEDVIAQDIIKIAERLAKENPVDLLVEMAEWTVDRLNDLGARIGQARRQGDLQTAERLARILEMRAFWAKRMFQRFFRLDPPVGPDREGIMKIPDRAADFELGEKATIDTDRARGRLADRITGDYVLEIIDCSVCNHRCAAGTDASVADVYLEHRAGSFIPPDPVAVMSAAAALKVRGDDRIHDYQEFDIFPERLKDYEDTQAAANGLVISPVLRSVLPEDDFRHARMAAMELRQYSEDLRVLLREARWRPMGEAPTLRADQHPYLLIRDGRLFPLVHRLKDYESSGLYGEIVRRQIQKFSDVLVYVFDSAHIVYGAVAKSPELSWLAPLVFWYLHTHGDEATRRSVSEDKVFLSPLADTAVSHLLFLGLAKTRPLLAGHAFVTFRVLRRFSDIALEGVPYLVDAGRALNEDEPDDWRKYIKQRVSEREQRIREGRVWDEGIRLAEIEYDPFIKLCTRAAVLMCYAAHATAYRPLVQDSSGAHFLLPRLEVAVKTEWPKEKKDRLMKEMLSWLATGGVGLDRGHTQRPFDASRNNEMIPILVPDVILGAHEAVTFARDELGRSVQDRLRELVAELKRLLSRRRTVP